MRSGVRSPSAPPSRRREPAGAEPLPAAGPGTALRIEGGRAEFRLSPHWTISDSPSLNSVPDLESRIRSGLPPSGSVRIDASEVATMDTAGALVLAGLASRLRASGFEVRIDGLPADRKALLELVDAHTGKPAAAAPARPPWIDRVWDRGTGHVGNAYGFLSFLGHVFVSSLGALVHPRRIRGRLVLRNLQTAGADALPIVGLLSFLIGVVMAYQGAIQLHRYGADLFIVDLLGLSLLRELAPLMTAIIVAARTGSAYTAQIGTMRVTEEVDALQVLGVSPVDVLVRPKVFALLIALPLLTAYADLVSVAGGMIMASLMTPIGTSFFLEQFPRVVDVPSYLVGIGKAPVFAAVIASVGCWQGFQASESAESVGARTTLSVVQSIFLIIVLDAMFSVVFSIVGI